MHYGLCTLVLYTLEAQAPQGVHPPKKTQISTIIPVARDNNL